MTPGQKQVLAQIKGCIRDIFTNDELDEDGRVDACADLVLILLKYARSEREVDEVHQIYMACAAEVFDELYGVTRH